MEREKATLLKVDRLDDLLVLKAQYQRFQFSRHSHEDFALGLMDEGVQQIYCRGQNYHAYQDNLITLIPMKFMTVNLQMKKRDLLYLIWPRKISH